MFDVTIIPFVMLFFIVFHHFIKHRNDKKLNFYQKIFQYSDINNHESFVLFFLGMGIGMVIK